MNEPGENIRNQIISLEGAERGYHEIKNKSI